MGPGGRVNANNLRASWCKMDRFESVGFIPHGCKGGRVCAILDEGGRDTLHQKCPRHSASVRPLPSARILRRALAIKPARATMALLAKD